MKYLVIVVLFFSCFLVNGQSTKLDVDYNSFLSKHDMIWTEIPNRWQLAPFSGNGNVGFLFYQNKEEGKNVISIYTGRHDYSDHREGKNKQSQMLWIYRSRLPLGHFSLASKGNIVDVNLRLSLHNAQLTGTVTTSKGKYEIKGYSHSDIDVISFETHAKKGESVTITWHPETPIPPVWEALQKGQGPKAPNWFAMRDAPMPLPEKYTLSKEGDFNFCYQPLYKNRGETTTAWEITGKQDDKQVLLTSIHHSFPENNSKAIAKENLNKAKSLLKLKTFESSHKDWWHNYYPLSFITINDAEKEAFYWIQMYKFASATRGSGPIMDLMGPWYNRTFWPMVWGDLNVELQYWTHLTANRLSVGSSLPNWIDKHAKNLEGNVPDRWENSTAIAALFPQDLIAYNGGKVPDMLAWILHDYWLHCQFSGDDERLRDGFFPLLKKTANSYLNYLKDNPVHEADGKIHIKNSWSPEYVGGRGQDINFTIGLMKWTFQTLIDLNEKHQLNDLRLSEWQNVMDNLVDFQIDENGLRIGKDIPFKLRHRHYSHLLPFYPLAVLSADDPKEKELFKTTLDHWLKVTISSDAEVKAMPVTGYTATGAASMYATLGDAEKAYYYLDFLIKHKNISPTTMYSEGGDNPVIESPLSFATCVHDMLLQSMNGVIKVFPGTPERWGDTQFYHLRTQGAFLVSAKKVKTKTEFIEIESLKGSKCILQSDVKKPCFYINGKTITSTLKVKKLENNFYEVDLKKGEVLVISSKDFDDIDFCIREIAIKKKEHNLFGLSKKTEKLSGHKYYFKK